jgi:transposase-like protein
MAVERVREGEDSSTAIASYGFCRTTIYKWLRAARERGKGLRALVARCGARDSGITACLFCGARSIEGPEWAFRPSIP